MLVAVCVIKREGNICGFLQMLKTLSYDDLATSKMVMQMCHIVILLILFNSCDPPHFIWCYSASAVEAGWLQNVIILLSNTVVFKPKFMNTLCHHSFIHSFIHSIGKRIIRRFLAVLRSFFNSSLLCTFSCHPSPPTVLQSSLTPSCHLFLGLPLSLLVPKFIYNTLLGILFSSILCSCPNQHNLTLLSVLQ